MLKELYEELKWRGDVIRQRESLEQSLKELMNGLSNIRRQCETQCRELTGQKGSLYAKYTAKQISAEEYRRQADLLDERVRELSQRKAEAEGKYEWAAEVSRKDMEDMKQIIRFSHLEELTQEAVEIYIKRVTLYRDKRVEIEWNFAERGSEDSTETNQKQLDINLT